MLIVVMLVVFALVLFAMAERDRQKEEFMSLGKAMNLTASHEGGWTLRGDWRGWAIQVRFWQGIGRNSEPTTILKIDGLDPSLHIEHKGLAATLFSTRPGELILGDQAIDARTILAGPERTLRGRLDARTRALLAARDAEGELTVDSGRLRHERRGHVLDPQRLTELLDWYVGLAERLRPGEVTDDQLLEIVRTDPVGSVRLNTALMLLADPKHTERVSEALGGDTPLCAALCDILRGQGDTLAQGRAGRLHELARLAPDQVCGLLQRAGSELALIELLSAHEPPVKVAAARALGAIGTVHAVEPLLPLTEDLLSDSAVKEAARQAVHEIQSRLGPVSAGSLSLSETEAEAGRLALAERAGKLSLR